MAMTIHAAAATSTMSRRQHHHYYDHASALKSIFATMDDILLSNHNDDIDKNDGSEDSLDGENNTAAIALGLKLLDSMMIMPRTSSSTNNNNNCTNHSEQHSVYHRRLLQSSSRIHASLQSQIDFETEQLEMESRELSSKLRAVTSLEHRVDALTKERDDGMERKKTLEHSIRARREEIMAATTASGSGAKDEDASRKKMIPKIGKEVSLHALMTNIRWDYNHPSSSSSSSAAAADVAAVDKSTTNDENNSIFENNNHHHHPRVLAGEIFHPTTQKVKKFVIDKAECNDDEYEIAESLWKLMEG